MALCLSQFQCFSQQTSGKFISENQALCIAKRHGLIPRILTNHPQVENINSSSIRIDTANKIWLASAQRRAFRNWGRTTRSYPGERPKRCKKVNGCYVVKSRLIQIDANTGKVLKKEKSKKVAGCYE
ncbi:MAG TPA: hypothetical protein PLQ93_01690 [Bacteroidia bacterium]|nr:hypothetical protein [Bacteroidia bacterium]